MVPEIILIVVSLLSLLIIKMRRHKFEWALSARIGMSAMLVMTAIGHILFTKGMAMMLPDFIPYRVELIYFTGLVEIAAAISLCVPSFRVLTAWLLIAFFILLLPANIYAAVKHVDLETATFNGKGPGYLWFRIPLQLFFIAWVYFSAIKPVRHKNETASS